MAPLYASTADQDDEEEAGWRGPASTADQDDEEEAGWRGRGGTAGLRISAPPPAA